MSLRTQTWMIACLLILAGLAFSGASVTAGDKKAVLLSKAGELRDDDEKDTKRTNSPRRIFTVKFEEGREYQIDLKSKDFDSYLRLEDSTGKEVAFDDDGGGFPDAKITHKAAKSGEFKVIVTSFDGKAGNFMLTVTGTAGGGDEKKVGGAVLTKAGELTADDGKDTKLSNSPRKIFPITLAEGKTYQFDLRSKDFDSYLRLEDSTGKQVAEDDDGGGFPNARMIYTAVKGGEYKIIVTSFDGKGGKFMLNVAEAAKGSTSSIFKDKASPLEFKNDKTRIEGELAEGAPMVQNHYYRIYTAKLQAGKIYRFDHMSDDVDAFLFLEDPNGSKIAQDDNGGDGKNARILHKAAMDGEYRVIATSLRNKETGKFILEINPASAAEVKLVALMDRLNDLDKASAPDQKKLIQEATEHLKEKGTRLTLSDANMVSQLTMAIEGTVHANDVFKNLGQMLSAADNQQVASLAKSFERIGKEFPISGKTVDGKEYDLKNMKGKVVLVDFWATWCGPCIAELPNMEAAYKKYHGKGFDIIGISLDRPGDDEKLSKFIENRKMAWPCITIEDSRPLANQYGVNAIPYPVLVDAQGRVVSLRARGAHLDRLLERMLGEKK